LKGGVLRVWETAFEPQSQKKNCIPRKKKTCQRSLQNAEGGGTNPPFRAGCLIGGKHSKNGVKKKVSKLQ